MTSPLPTPARRRGRLLLAAGLACALLGFACCAAQFAAARLFVPWYLPAATTLGALLVAVSLWQARSVVRVLSLLVVVLLAVGAWRLVLAHQTPPYTGPVAEGEPFPAFTTLRADGAPFTQKDLRGGPDRVLVFFRGRW
jgi:hypothetical protein